MHLHGEITGLGHVGTIHKVAHISIVNRLWQWRSGSMHIRLHGFRMVHGIPCCIHGCTIWKVTHRIAKECTRQWGSWPVRLWGEDDVFFPVPKKSLYLNSLYICGNFSPKQRNVIFERQRNKQRIQKTGLKKHPLGDPGVCGSGPIVSGWLMALPALFIGVPSGR